MELQNQIENSWYELLKEEFAASYFKELETFLFTEQNACTVFPPAEFIFEAFNRTPVEKVRVVIIGQDPYHGKGQAHGLSFSVQQGTAIPPSLRNIYKELHADLGIPPHTSGDLGKWADQGVLLLNATLTVKESCAGSHQNKGWERFTDAVIKKLSDSKSHLVFMLWGKFAQSKENMINSQRGHLILKAAHPSFFSVKDFFGCRHFSKANEFLASKGLGTIDWNLSE